MERIAGIESMDHATKCVLLVESLRAGAKEDPALFQLLWMFDLLED